MVSRKGDYADRLGSEDIEASVRSLMESQHKTMLKGLQAGEFDTVIQQRVGPNVFRDVTDGADTMTEQPPTAESQAPVQPVTPPAPVAPAPAAPGESAAQESSQPAAASAQDQLNRAFGEGVVSEKPLDEVVLDYLVENARKRKRRSR